MKPRYRVTLTLLEREELEALTKTAKTNAKQFLYARALLLCDAGTQGTGWSVADTAEAMGVPPREVTFDGAFEARLIALACSKTPEGRGRWTVRLLAEKAVEMSLASSVSQMTVQRILKKTNLSLTSESIGKSRPRRAPHS
jgi:hypothetical protein